MQLNTGQWIVIGVCGILIAGYIGGYYYNRRRAEQVYAWLRRGLAAWGNMSAGERLGGLAVGGRLKVAQPVRPFQRVDVIFLLEPRENLPFWLFHRLQGRRDELILKVNFRGTPTQEVEVARRNDREFRRRIAGQPNDTFTLIPNSSGCEVALRGSNADPEKIQKFLEHYGKAVYRFWLRQDAPHLFLRAYLHRLEGEPAEVFFSTLRELA
jgi:hypothetical protein